MTTTSKVITIRAKAFTGFGIEEVKCIVINGAVLVWDSVAGHYTNCHSLSRNAQARVRKLAAK